MRAFSPTERTAAAMALAACAWFGPAGEPPRIGDPGSVFDPAKYDDRFPDSKEWAAAGVEGGIPFRRSTPVVARLKPGDDLQAAVDRAKKGVVLLAPGIYQLDKTIELRNGVIVRGEDKETTILEYGVQEKNCRNLFMFRKVEQAGVEDLTMRQAQVFKMDPKEYQGLYQNHPDFIRDNAAAIEMVGAKNCWVQNCDILFSLSRPVRIHGGCRHVTMRDNYVDKCLHRGGQGAGYYEVVGAEYVLMYNETVKNVRHICLDAKIDYTVLVHCKVSVDINWHCIQPMAKSLVERVNSDAEAVGHRWPTFCHYRDRMAPDNLIYMTKPGFDDGQVYHPVHGGKPFIQKADLPQPKFGTLFPVTGVHRPPDDPRAAAPLPAPAAPPAAPQKTVEAPKKAEPPKEEPKEIPAETVAAWDAKLLEALRAAVAAKSPPRFRAASLKQEVTAKAVDAAGVMTLSGAGLEMPFPFARLTLSDKRELAEALAKPDSPSSCALAAFFLLAAGDRERGEKRLLHAGDDAAGLRALFP